MFGDEVRDKGRIVRANGSQPAVKVVRNGRVVGVANGRVRDSLAIRRACPCRASPFPFPARWVAVRESSRRTFAAGIIRLDKRGVVARIKKTTIPPTLSITCAAPFSCVKKSRRIVMLCAIRHARHLAHPAANSAAKKVRRKAAAIILLVQNKSPSTFAGVRFAVQCSPTTRLKRDAFPRCYADEGGVEKRRGIQSGANLRAGRGAFARCARPVRPDIRRGAVA